MLNKVNTIIQQAKQYLTDPDIEEKIIKAYTIADNAHKGQIRHSGDPYIVHPVEATAHLMSLHPDLSTIQASLLHDVPEDTPVTLDQIQEDFGEDVMNLTKAMEKLGKIKYRGEDRAIENLKKMFLAMSKDIRVIFIKLCDRLHNMETLRFHPKQEKIQRIALETLNIYAPIAARLGIYHIKNALEDLCFQILYPKEFQKIDYQLQEKSDLQKQFVTISKQQLSHIFQEHHIEAEVIGRIKTPYSIFKKMQAKGKTDIDELYDIFALRVIVQDKANCYAALGLIHQYFTPIPQRFKDYIAVPKTNNYQSLHTTVMGLGKKFRSHPTEIQIRTVQMNHEAEYGIAAHFLYKENKQNHTAWIQGLADISAKLNDHSELVSSVRMDLYSDRIFVFTPRGDVIELPAGSTPVDFAYAIHTDIGNHCRGAKIDDTIVPLHYELHSGDIVEIITKKDAKPTQYWLAFVKTNGAKSKIKSWFLEQKSEDMLKLGRELFNNQLKRFGYPSLDPTLTLLSKIGDKDLPIKERERVIENIGNGSISAISIIRKLFPIDSTRTEKKETSTKISSEHPEIYIAGETGINYKLSACCHPTEKDSIVGYVTRGSAVSIHKKNCKMLKSLSLERFVPASWSTDQETRLITAQLTASTYNRIGLLRDFLDVLYKFKLNIVNIATPVKGISNNIGTIIVDIQVQNFEELDQIISTLSVIDSIITIEGKIL